MTSAISTQVQVATIWASIIGFNINDAMSWPWPALGISYSYFAPSGPYVDINGSFQSYNTFWGNTWFGISNIPNLQWSSTLNIGSSVTAASTFAFNNMQFFGFTLTYKECVTTTPYYMTSQGLCYDICPNLYY